MIPIDEVIALHALLVEQFGGSHDLRDRGALESALIRPFQSFEGVELYPTPLDKAAALFESIITNHPFIDGNKRVAYSLLLAHLASEHLDIQADADSKYEFVIAAASGHLDHNAIVAWLRAHAFRVP